MLRKFLILLLVLACAGCATYVATSGRVVVRDDSAAAKLRFNEHDRARVIEYYRVHRAKKSPPGLAKRETSSPGLMKHEALPPGLPGRPLPRELESRLPVLPGTHMRLIVGHDLALIDRNTRVVLDVLYGVVD